jgi:prevent-host-death family protein
LDDDFDDRFRSTASGGDLRMPSAADLGSSRGSLHRADASAALRSTGAIIGVVEKIGLRELRQHASEFVRRAEEGEELLVTVAGRPAAVLGPAAPTQWRRFADIAAIFAGPSDPRWTIDRDSLDAEARDPWLR